MDPRADSAQNPGVQRGGCAIGSPLNRFFRGRPPQNAEQHRSHPLGRPPPLEIRRSARIEARLKSDSSCPESEQLRGWDARESGQWVLLEGGEGGGVADWSFFSFVHLLLGVGWGVSSPFSSAFICFGVGGIGGWGGEH